MGSLLDSGGAGHREEHSLVRRVPFFQNYRVVTVAREAGLLRDCPALEGILKPEVHLHGRGGTRERSLVTDDVHDKGSTLKRLKRWKSWEPVGQWLGLHGRESCCLCSGSRMTHESLRTGQHSLKTRPTEVSHLTLRA